MFYHNSDTHNLYWCYDLSTAAPPLPVCGDKDWGTTVFDLGLGIINKNSVPAPNDTFFNTNLIWCKAQVFSQSTVLLNLGATSMLHVFRLTNAGEINSFII